jgi:PAS domain S-box-containing protein
VALVLLAARRDAARTRGALLLVALFFLFAGGDKIFEVSGMLPFRGWWNFLTAVLSIAAAGVIIAYLPRFLRMPEIAEELRGQAGFLEEQQSLLQAIQDSVSDGIMLINQEGQIKAFNAAALRILWGLGEQRSKPLPEMREAAIRALAQQTDQEVVRWDGRLIERFVTNVEGYGKLYVFRDITSRRQLEEQRLRLERVITSMKEGFAIVSFDTRTIVSTNPAMEEMLGYEGGELAGRPFSEIQAGDERQRNEAVDRIVESVAREGFWEGETRNRRKDGAELILHTTVSLVREGESQYFSCIQVDITDQKRLREEKEHLQVKLMEAQRLESLGRLAEGVGHEFNNLLTGIMGNTGLALDMTRPGDPVAGMLEDVMRASERAAAVSRQLLAFSGRTAKFVVNALDLSELIEELAGLAQASISKKVQLRLRVERGIPLVEGDATQLRQVALNLIVNAAEASGNAGGAVTVSTGVEQITALPPREPPAAGAVAPGRYVFLEVRDEGCGMSEETRAHIFDPFFTTKAAGRGLGLAAVTGIVRAHRGTIHVESAPGKGSAFRVLFPAAEARAPRGASSAAGPARGKGTILVVEDEPIVRRTTLAALTQYGFDVRTAENGQIAVEMFQEMADEISLVLLDVVMPVMGGEEALTQIKAIRPEVPVVICSGHNEVETVERFNRSDVAGIIKKPYTARQLVDQLKAALERSGAPFGARLAGQ